MAEQIARQNPFPGLRAFEDTETHLFFGRDGQSDELLRLLAANRFVAVVGTSGSGKSSLVRAGMVPALQSGFMTAAGSSWRIAIMRPGAYPIAALATALNERNALGRDDLEPAERQAMLEAVLSRSSFGLVEAVREAWMARHENLLLLVDQFEELFRLRSAGKPGGTADQSAAFVKLILEAARQAELPIYIALTMRSDFLGDCAEFRDLPETLNRSQYLIPRMTRDQRRAAIEGPVAVEGAKIAPRLVQRLLNDVGDDPDQLPLLQHALMRTWDAWAAGGNPGAPVDLEHYDSVGGIVSSLSRHVDEAYSELDGRGREIARRLFQQLSERGSDNRETRRPTALAQIAAVAQATEAETIAVIDRFRRGGRTFLMPPAGEALGPDSVIDISHESLIRLWERLRGWVDEEAESAILYARLADAAARHQSGNAALLRDPELQLALDWRRREQPNAAWAQRYNPGFDVTMEFLAASERQREVERHQRAVARRMRRAVVGSMAAAAVALAWLGHSASVDAARARRSEQEALASQLAAASVQQWEEGKAVRGTLLAMESMKRAEQLDRDARADGAALESAIVTDDDEMLRRAQHMLPKPVFRTNFCDKPGPSGCMDERSHRVETVAFSPDGKFVLAGGQDGTARLFDAASGKEVARVTHSDTVNAVAFSPDGTLAASAGEDGAVKVVSLPPLAGHERTLYEPGPTQHTARAVRDVGVHRIVFSPDGRLLTFSGAEGVVRTVKVATGQPVAMWTAAAAGVVNAAATERSAEESEKGEEQNRIRAMALSPDGRYLLLGGETPDLKKKIWIYDREDSSGKPLFECELGAPPAAVQFDPQGNRFAAGSSNTVRILEFSQQCLAQRTLAGLKRLDCVSEFEMNEPVTSLAFNRDGTRLAVGSQDKTARVLDIYAHEISRLRHAGAVLDVAFSPDGRYVATGSDDNTLRIFRADTGREVALLDHSGDVNAVAFNPDATRLAAASNDGTIEVLKVPNEQEIKLYGPGKHLAELNFLFQSGAGGRAVAFDPSGTYLAVAGSDGVNVYPVDDADSWRPVLSDPSGGLVTAVAFGPPETHYLIAGGWDGKARLYSTLDWNHPPLVLTDPGQGAVLSIAISPDGLYCATGSEDRIARVFEIRSGKLISREIGHDGHVHAVDFFPDGHKLLTGSDDHTARVWDPATGKQLGEPFSADGKVWSVTVSPNGRYVSAIGWDRIARIYDLVGGSIFDCPHNKRVTAFAFSPDSRMVATASEDSMARLWKIPDLDSRGQQQALTPAWMGDLGGKVNRIAFEREGKSIFFGGERGIQVFDLRAHSILGRVDADLIVQTWAVRQKDIVFAAAEYTPRDREWKIFARETPALGGWDDATLDEMCRRLGRNLNCEEWNRLLPGQRPDKTCADQPLLECSKEAQTSEE